jgi:predicted phosphodiesterase
MSKPKSIEDLGAKSIRKIHTLYSQGMGKLAISREVGCTEHAVRKVLPSQADQACQDAKRLARKEQRSDQRSAIAIDALNRGVMDALVILGKSLPRGKRRTGKLATKAPVAVVHLSDNHLNELISTPSNTFDFEIGAKRLQLLAMKVRSYCGSLGVKKLVIAFGGDLINSDRRIDEVTNMATNRSRAMVLAAYLYQQFIADLREDFFIDVFGITGNEGRAKQELSWAEPGVSDSYDASIYYMLTAMMNVHKDDGLRFHSLQGNEAVFSIYQETFLLVHGHQINMGDQRKVQSLIGKHAALNGVRITHVLAGHIHSAMISDYASRNSSMSGGNAYSEDALGFCSKASQNVHIVHGPGSTHIGLDGIKMDLQNVEGISGYNLVNVLQAHDARGSRKAALAAVNQARRQVIVV